MIKLLCFSDFIRKGDSQFGLFDDFSLLAIPFFFTFFRGGCQLPLALSGGGGGWLGTAGTFSTALTGCWAPSPWRGSKTFANLFLSDVAQLAVPNKHIQAHLHAIQTELGIFAQFGELRDFFGSMVHIHLLGVFSKRRESILMLLWCCSPRAWLADISTRSCTDMIFCCCQKAECHPLSEPNLFRHICSDHRLTIGFVSSIFHSSSISPESHGWFGRREYFPRPSVVKFPK